MLADGHGKKVVGDSGLLLMVAGNRVVQAVSMNHAMEKGFLRFQSRFPCKRYPSMTLFAVCPFFRQDECPVRRKNVRAGCRNRFIPFLNRFADDLPVSWCGRCRPAVPWWFFGRMFSVWLEKEEMKSCSGCRIFCRFFRKRTHEGWNDKQKNDTSFFLRVKVESIKHIFQKFSWNPYMNRAVFCVVSWRGIPVFHMTEPVLPEH